LAGLQLPDWQLPYHVHLANGINDMGRAPRDKYAGHPFLDLFIEVSNPSRPGEYYWSHSWLTVFFASLINATAEQICPGVTVTRIGILCL